MNEFILENRFLVKFLSFYWPLINDFIWSDNYWYPIFIVVALPLFSIASFSFSMYKEKDSCCSFSPCLLYRKEAKGSSKKKLPIIFAYDIF